MRDRTHNARIPLPALAAVVTLGVIALAWVALRNGEPRIEVTPPAPVTAPAEPVRIADADPLTDPPAVVKLRELRAMSETYRNTTFLIAIRDVGYTCHELLDVHGGVDDALAWTAACSDMLAYTVRIANSGALAVEPLATYFDGLAPRVDQQQQLPEPQQRLQQLPPSPRR
jgi:hypothetical protein